MWTKIYTVAAWWQFCYHSSATSFRLVQIDDELVDRRSDSRRLCGRWFSPKLLRCASYRPITKTCRFLKSTFLNLFCLSKCPDIQRELIWKEFAVERGKNSEWVHRQIGSSFCIFFLWIQRSNGFLWLIKRFLFVSDTSTERVPFFPSVRQHSAKAHQSPIKIPHTVVYFMYLFYFVPIILYIDQWKISTNEKSH